MKLKQYQAAYYESSGQVSSIVRQLAFAGLAVVWIFRVNTSVGEQLDPLHIVPAGAFVLSLVFDLFQYITATCVWGIRQWRIERQHYRTFLKEGYRPDTQYYHKGRLKWPQFGFFWLKIVTVLVGHAFLLVSLTDKLL